jgi:chorismate mutase/prephenate dehydratase
VIAREPEPWDPRVPCKTSVMFVIQHREGALLACLNVLAAHALNRPSSSRAAPGRPFEYLFYVEFEGNVAKRHRPAGDGRAVGLTLSLKIFGSYPANDTRWV